MRQVDQLIKEGHEHTQQRKSPEHKADHRLQDNEQRHNRKTDDPPNPSQEGAPELSMPVHWRATAAQEI